MAPYIKAPIRQSSPRRWMSRSWWAILFVIVCGGFYVHAIRQKELSYNEMVGRLQALDREKALALAEREELLLQIRSQLDPAWIELILKRNLGMVSEDQVKVYFHQE